MVVMDTLVAPVKNSCGRGSVKGVCSEKNTTYAEDSHATDRRNDACILVLHAYHTKARPGARKIPSRAFEDIAVGANKRSAQQACSNILPPEIPRRRLGSRLACCSDLTRAHAGKRECAHDMGVEGNSHATG